MPPLPEINNVFRITINYLPARGVTPRNVFHIRSASTDVDDIGEAIDAAAQGELMMSGMIPDHRPETFDLLPLDGETATRTYAFSEGAWTTSSASGETSPATAAVVSLRTNQRGARGRGRVFIGPMTEASILNGQITGDVADELPEAWQNFRDSLETNLPNMNLVVASYKYADAHDVNSINVDAVLGTQRRRQDQLR